MKVFCFTLTILCAVQSILAIPRPDFAISGAVSGSATLNTAAGDLKTESNNPGLYTVDLTSGYTLLTTVRTALEAIGDDISTAGKNLATQLSTLALDNAGPITASFDAVDAKVTAYGTLITGAFSGNLAAVTTATGAYIEKQLKDAFKTVGTTLTALSKALLQLRTEVNNAKTNGGTAAAIKKYITPKTVNDVTAQIRNLRANTPLISFVINSSLDNLKIVDLFINDMKNGVDAAQVSFDTSLSGFKTNLDAQATETNGVFGSNIGSSVTSLLSSIQSTLDAAPKYTSDLAPKIALLNTAVTTTVTTTQTAITNAFTKYGTDAKTLIPDLKAAFGDKLCKPLRSVSLVQIANHGFSDFCFSKYSPRVYAQISLTIDAFDVCFQKEIGRLIPLTAVVTSIVQQIAYNTADVFDNLSACLALPDANKGACFTAIVPYYDVIAAKAAANLGTVATLIGAETKASYNRVGACLYASLSVTALSAAEIATNADGCLTAGPQP